MDPPEGSPGGSPRPIPPGVEGSPGGFPWGSPASVRVSLRNKTWSTTNDSLAHSESVLSSRGVKVWIPKPTKWLGHDLGVFRWEISWGYRGESYHPIHPPPPPHTLHHHWPSAPTHPLAHTIGQPTTVAPEGGPYTTPSHPRPLAHPTQPSTHPELLSSTNCLSSIFLESRHLTVHLMQTKLLPQPGTAAQLMEAHGSKPLIQTLRATAKN